MPDDRYSSISGAHAAADRSPGALVSALISDFSDLMRKEIALATGELSHNLSQKAAGSALMGVAGMVLLVALLTLVAGVVFLIASFGIAIHVSAFIVAAGLAVLGAILFFAGKSKMKVATMPERSMSQVKEDVRVIKEQMQ